MTKKAEQVYEDKWGAIIYRSEKYIEIRWYDTTSSLSGDEFQKFLVKFAGLVEEHNSFYVLVDATSFRMDPSRMHTGWRDITLIPRYNAAGIKKFAFIMPDGMPAIGQEPAPEGPANFPTAYFGSRVDALNWLAI